MDADYCVQMIKVLHTQGTPGFWTMKVYDQVCCTLWTVGLVSLPSF